MTDRHECPRCFGTKFSIRTTGKIGVLGYFQVEPGMTSDEATFVVECDSVQRRTTEYNDEPISCDGCGAEFEWEARHRSPA
jgi:hypothetical protein